VGNIGEEDIRNPEGNAHYVKLMALAAERQAPCIPICSKLEAEIQDLPEEDGHQVARQIVTEDLAHALQKPLRSRSELGDTRGRAGRAGSLGGVVGGARISAASLLPTRRSSGR